MTGPASPKILLVTASQVAARAVMDVSTQVREIHNVAQQAVSKAAYFQLGENGGVELYLVQLSTSPEQMTREIAEGISQAIQEIHPVAVISIGTVWGLNSQAQRPGDILISREIKAFELYTTKSAVNYRPNDGWSGFASARLVEQFSNPQAWTGANIIAGTFWCMDEATSALSFLSQIESIDPQVVGVDIGGAGIKITADQAKVDWILVKGIAGFANKSETSSASVNQQALEFASRNAASYMQHIIKQGRLAQLYVGEAKIASGNITQANPSAKPPQLNFGELFKAYRTRANNPKTGKPPYSRDLMADTLGELSGVSRLRHKFTSWENEAAPYREGAPLLHHITAALIETGGISQLGEVNALYQAANIQPLPEDLLKAMLDQPSNASEILIKADILPAGSPQADKVDITRPGRLISVIKEANGWNLAVEALALPPQANFYNALKENLPETAQRMLDDVVKANIHEKITYDHPQLVLLTPELGKQVLPQTPTGKTSLILTLARDVEGKFNLEFIQPMLRGVLKLASESGIRTLAMPLIGTGGRKGRYIDVLERMLEVLFEEGEALKLEWVVILTIRADVVDAARRYADQHPPIEEKAPDQGVVIPSSTETQQALLPRTQKWFNDLPLGEDQLGIKEEVYALADTLLLRDVTPPIAVGVMGGWGSGKSFILHLIQERMTEQRTWEVEKGYQEDAHTGRVLDYVGHIYMIRFNAWTYAKSNLWASLMQTIFFELNRQLSLEKLFSNNFPPLKGGGIYRLLYKEGNHADEGLLRLLVDRNFLTKEDIDMILSQGQGGQVLWDTLRERKAEYSKQLEEMEKSLTQEQLKLDDENRRLQELANSQLDQQDRHAGFYAVKNLAWTLTGDVLGEKFKQLILIQDLDEGLIIDIQGVLNDRESTNQDKISRLQNMQVDLPHIDMLLKAWRPEEVEKRLLDKSIDDLTVIKEILKSQKMTAEQAQQALETLQSGSAILKRFWNTAWKNKGWSAFFLISFIILLTGLPIFLEFILGQIYWNNYLFMRLTSLVTSFIPFIPPATQTIQKWNKQVAKILDQYDQAVERGKQDWDKRREIWLDERRSTETKNVNIILLGVPSPDEKKIALAKLADEGNLTAQQTLVKLQETEVEDLRRKIGPTSKFVSLLDFVRSRLDEKNYESQLGLMHQVKNDIDELTDSLTICWEDEEMEIIQKKMEFFPRGPARVVLFIDDLDRCPPPRVVEVLEAVQLLLNTELFVVVLGLDTRYITLALEKEYKEILRHEGDPSGLDYIEKIIQIPYGVRPIEKDGLDKFLHFQMDIETTTPAESTQKDARAPGIEAAPAGQLSESVQPTVQTGGVEKEAEEKILAPEEATQTVGTEVKTKDEVMPALEGELPGSEIKPEEIVGAQAGEPTGVLSAEQVKKIQQDFQKQFEPSSPPNETEQKFTQEDFDDLLACGEIIDLTPRAVRRLINVLKLAKVYWGRTQGKDPERDIKRTVIGMLALSAAYPEVMREVFVHIEQAFGDPVKSVQTMATLMESQEWQEHIEKTFAWQLNQFRNDVTRLGKIDFCCTTPEKLEIKTFNIVRSFSFVGDPSYWSDQRTRSQVDPAETTSSTAR